MKGSFGRVVVEFQHEIDHVYDRGFLCVAVDAYRRFHGVGCVASTDIFFVRE